MSARSWKKKLAKLLTRLTTEPLPRLVLLGIGSELDGDDAAGMAAVRRLKARFPSVERVLLVEAGTAPENFTGLLRKFRPDEVVLIDTGDFGGQAGEIRLLDWRTAEGFSASTHTLPLSVFSGYLEAELGCPVVLLAIQPEQIEFGQGLSAAVEQAINELVEAILKVI